MNPASYLPYSVQDPEWNCPVCYENNPKGVVAHERGGELHPIHKKCLFDWYSFSTKCPCCKIDTRIRSIAFPAMQFYIQAKRKWRSLVLSNRSFLAAQLGSFCLLAGYLDKNHIFKALGCGLHAVGLQGAIEEMEQDMEITQQIERLCQQLMGTFDMAGWEMLRILAAQRMRYNALLIPWTSFTNPRILNVAVQDLYRCVKEEHWNLRLLKLFRLCAGISALYYTFLFINRIKGKFLARNAV